MSTDTPEPSAGERSAELAAPLVAPTVTLRDYLAGQALAGICAAATEPAHGRAMQLRIAETAYQIADVMIEKRSR